MRKCAKICNFLRNTGLLFGFCLFVNAKSLSKVEALTQSEQSRFVYRIGPRDVLEITVLSLKEFERQGYADELSFIVNDNGFVNVPIVGLVKADNLTPFELIEALEEKFKKYVNNPQVSVVVKKYGSKLVYVLGKVFQNGPIPLRHENTSLFEVLSEAGGFSSHLPSLEGVQLTQPDMRHVYVIRKNKKFIVNLYDRILDMKDDKPFFMEPGDKIFVPEPVETISVLGGVKKAGSFELKPELTMMKAIALAGSFVEDARRDVVNVIRKGEGKPIRVNAVRIFEGKEPDFSLKAGDVIYVAEW